jgi:hypothetical protein
LQLGANIRFSGHETFVCRYSWLPKAGMAVLNNSSILTSTHEDEAMVELGVGKNMVRSIRFWAEASDIIAATEQGHEVTEFGKQLLFDNSALDPFLEEIQTLWLIHWKLATNPKTLIFAWDYLLNHFHEPELYASAVVRAFTKATSQSSDKKISQSSLEQLFEIFLHSYVPTRGRKGEVREDNLDSPLVELDLLRHTGFTKSALYPSRQEAKYAFRRDEKPEINQALFAFCLEEFWNNKFFSGKVIEGSIPFHAVVSGHGSPGQIFKIPEHDIRTRLYGIEKQTDGFFTFEESATIPRVVRHDSQTAPSLADIYQWETANA